MDFSPIASYDDYFVNRDGVVLSKKYGKERILKPHDNSHGYYIVNLWKRYINLRKQSMLQVIKESQDVLEKIDTVPDITFDDLSLLYIIRSTIQTNNT